MDRGVVVVDKPSGPTSHEVASWVADILGVSKAAHTGTLDPRVTGCLPVLFGPAARVSGMFSGDKTYVFVLELHDDRPRDEVERVFAEFEGGVYQRPPVQGSARRDLRTRRIHELELLETDGARHLGRVVCAPGTYIRKLCHDIGLALGAGGHMAELRRTRSGTFGIEDACYLQDIADAVAHTEADRLDVLVTPLRDALGALGLPTVKARPSAVDSVSHGSPLFAPGVVSVEGDSEQGEKVLVVSEGAGAVAVGTYTDEGDAVVETDTVLVPR